MVKRQAEGWGGFRGQELLRLAACPMLSLACNILAPLFSPVAGIWLAIGGVLCWLLSLQQVTSLRSKLSKHALATTLAVFGLVAIAIWTSVVSVRAYRREFSDKQAAPCQTGDTTANGDGNTVVSGCGNNVNAKPK